MSKKNWIMIKRGLSQDAKHRETIGQAIWCYMHIIDRADWETGIVYDWKDKDEADDMGVNVRTLRAWRQSLDANGYITCVKEQYGQRIIVHNWTNPKSYGGKVINQSDKKTVPQSDTQSDITSVIKDVTPTYTSINQESGIKEGATAPKPKTREKKSSGPKLTDIPELVIYREVARHWPKPQQRDHVISAVKKITNRLGRVPTKEDLTPFWDAWAIVSSNDWSLVWLVEWAVSGNIPQNGKKPQAIPQGVSAAQSWLQKRQAQNG